MKIRCLFFCIILLYANLSFSQKIIQLYDGKPKGAEKWTWSEQTTTNNPMKLETTYNVSQPTLTAYLPEVAKAKGSAVIIAPGGAFHTLAIKNEGEDVAKWLNSKGIAAFVLKYRVVHSLTDDPVKELMAKMSNFKTLDMVNDSVVTMALQDGLTAMKYVRKHAKEMNIDAQRIGFMGFSAGATLTMSVMYNANDEERPNFVAPIYIYENAIIGANIPKEKTPIFIAAANDDQLGLASHSVNIYKKWSDAHQPSELHLYENGGHGFGMSKQGTSSDKWVNDFENWLNQQKLLFTLYEIESQERRKVSFADMARWNEEWEYRLHNDWANLSRYQEANQKLKSIKENPKRVVFIGDSITEGWVNQDADYWTSKDYVGRGIGGQTTPQALVRFRSDVLNLKPAAVVILLGTNDVAENTGRISTEEIVGNIASMAELAKANKVKVIICSILPAYDYPWRKGLNPADKILKINALLKEYATKNACTYLDYHSNLKDNRNGLPSELAEDGVHPNLKCYKMMETMADKAISETINKK